MTYEPTTLGYSVGLDKLHAQLDAVERADHGARRVQSVIRELDRLAEHLVGCNTPEAKGMKRRIQELLLLVAPTRPDVPRYIEIYCRKP